MFFASLVLIFEGILCNFILMPNSDVEQSTCAVVLLVINIVVVCLGISFSIKNNNVEEERSIKLALFSSFFLRILILLWDVYCRHIFILPNSEGDAEWYHKIGVSYAFGTRAQEVDYTKYSYYIGQLYKFIGVQKMTAQFINVFLAMCSLILVYKILCKFDIDTKVKKITITIAAFLPNLMMITTFFLQESIIAFFVISSLYLFTRWWFGKSAFNIVLAILFSVAGAMLHMGGFAIGIGILMMLFLVNNKERKVSATPARLVMVIIMAFVALFAISTFGGDLLGKLGGEVSAEAILDKSGDREIGGGAYVIGIQGLPPAVDIVVNTPIRMFYFIFSPLPWMWRGPGDILAFFGSTIFYIYVVYLTIKAFKTKPNKTLVNDNLGSYLITLTVIVLIAAVMFGWGVSNSGSVIRHREKFTYICVVMFAISQEILFRTEKVNAEQESIDNSSDIQGRRLPKKMR
ncbi:MAG: hypothetical protein E7513_02900 [Ruminococcaceae bacterium]|nr:hypothetical protein [Oscillospiraceae bacterium]